MPKIELKAAQTELEQGKLWPLYWLYGAEKLKAKEFFKRIRNTVLQNSSKANTSGEESGALSPFGSAWNERVLEGTEVTADEVIEAAQSPVLGGEIQLILVRDAHAIKNPEELSVLMGPPQKRNQMSSVVVCFSKELDARKKISKILVEKAAVIPCEEVHEAQREAWILYLAKRVGVTLTPNQILKLASLDPWSLEMIENELTKISLSGPINETDADKFVTTLGSDAFLDAFFKKDLDQALASVANFADQPDESLPLLGLLGWNVRQLALYLTESKTGGRSQKINPYLADRLRVWSEKWSLKEVIQLQKELTELDFQLKQTPLLPLGVWSLLVTRHCRH